MLKHFRVQTAVRVAGIALLVALAVGSVVSGLSLVAGAVLGALAVWQTAALVRYVERTNRELTRFLEAVRYDDFGQGFSGAGRGASFEALAAAFRAVMDDFRQARAEAEASYRYLDTVVQHVGVGVMAFRPGGEVALVNTAAKKLLGASRIRHLRDLEAVSPEVAATLARLRSGERALVKLVADDALLQLAVYATEVRLRDEHYKLVSIQNIQQELEEAEGAAWQKLTRVLTHEIMNSVAPIASLAASAHDLLDAPAALDDDAQPASEPMSDPMPEPARLDGETLADVREAVATIERRSHSLLAFVQAYRRLTRVPQPDFQIVPAARLIGDVAALLRPDFEAAGVALDTHVAPATLELTADPSLVEQVLINLLRNALQATAGRPGAAVRVEATLGPRGRPAVQVIDNGPGIVEEALDKVFVPFFTTKPDGSGIGLSLSREIQRQHGGTLTAVSAPGERTVFTLRF